jgi:hypothetical protein
MDCEQLKPFHVVGELTPTQRSKIIAIVKSEQERDRPENIWIRKAECCECNRAILSQEYTEKEAFLSFYYGMCRGCVLKFISVFLTLTVDEAITDILSMKLE